MFEDRIEAVRQLISQHNAAIGENNAGYVNSDLLIDYIKASGGTNEERLAGMSHEDILECMTLGAIEGQSVVTGPIKPRLLAKNIASLFRAKETPTEDKVLVSAKKAEKMTLQQLVASFDPEDCDNSVGKRLNEISKGEAFIIYSEGRLVDVDSTIKLLTEIKQGYKGRLDLEINGVVKKVYKLGELPENYAEENPIYANRPLRPDGTCDQTGRSWEGIELQVRQLVRVAIDIGELKATHEIAHNTLDVVMEVDAMKKLRQRYRKASVQFDELAKTGNLPKLKIALSGGSEGKRPFDNGVKVIWPNPDPRLGLPGPGPVPYYSNKAGTWAKPTGNVFRKRTQGW